MNELVINSMDSWLDSLGEEILSDIGFGAVKLPEPQFSHLRSRRTQSHFQVNRQARGGACELPTTSPGR